MPETTPESSQGDASEAQEPQGSIDHSAASEWLKTHPGAFPKRPTQTFPEKPPYTEQPRPDLEAVVTGQILPPAYLAPYVDMIQSARDQRQGASFSPDGQSENGLVFEDEYPD